MEIKQERQTEFPIYKGILIYLKIKKSNICYNFKLNKYNENLLDTIFMFNISNYAIELKKR